MDNGRRGVRTIPWNVERESQLARGVGAEQRALADVVTHHREAVVARLGHDCLLAQASRSSRTRQFSAWGLSKQVGHAKNLYTIFMPHGAFSHCIASTSVLGSQRQLRAPNALVLRS